LGVVTPESKYWDLGHPNIFNDVIKKDLGVMTPESNYWDLGTCKF